MLSSLCKSVLHCSGVLALLRAAAARSRAVVLRYHSVSAVSDQAELYLDPGLTLSPEAFERQIRFLSQHYTLVPLEDIVDCLRRGQRLYRRAVAITFDDGYRDNYTQAFPILRRYQVPATFYLTTGCIDNEQIFWVAHLRYLLTASRAEELRLTRPEAFSFDLSRPGSREATFRTLVVRMKNISTAKRHEMLAAVAEQLAVDDSPLRGIMMRWEEAREMHSQGMSFGAHTVTHPNLPNTAPEEAEREIRESKEAIEGRLRTRVHAFSYPNGRGSNHLTEQVKQIVRQTGFHSAVTSLPGCIEQGNDLFALKRVGVYKKHGRLSFLSWEMESNRWKR
ncbi:MAG: polysaccharide deacetylase family protein [Deltaproteobacteria bacterium]|nr:polysaccharide deacetylase family protein [Deltaproteobacteria bacterium]